jgi:purine-binding chemotaxis protein CheW
MPESAPRSDERQQYLSFFFAGEEYGAEILTVREVVEYQRLTAVPTAPEWVRGVMNLRGAIVPVLDLATKLHRSGTAVAKLTCIVIFEVELDGEAIPVGVLIDAVGRVFELGADEIQEPPALGSPVRPDLLVGLGIVEETPIALLNVQKVLTEAELVEAVAAAEGSEVEPEASAPKAGPSEKPEAGRGGETGNDVD